MGYSKRKPYHHLGGSLIDFFKAPVRYLKESNIKESVFEKPYREGSYPEMHFKIPTPNWGRKKKPKDVGAFGEIGTKKYSITYPYPDCRAFVGTQKRGETRRGSWDILWTPPHDLGSYWSWEFKVNAPEQIELFYDKSSEGSWDLNNYVSIEITPTEDAGGIFTICGTATWIGSGVIKVETEITPGQPLPSPMASSWRLAIEYKKGRTLTCCDEFKLDCIADASMAWDDNISASTIARNNSVTVAVTGVNSPFSWGVAGTGFSILTNTQGKSNTLSADDTACGLATITVTGCDGRVITGYVRCTTGVWVLKGQDSCPNPGPYTSVVYGSVFYTFTRIQGKDRIVQEMLVVLSSCDSSDCTEGLCSGYGYDHTQCITGKECALMNNSWYDCNAYWYCCQTAPACGGGVGYQCLCNSELNYYEWECE